MFVCMACLGLFGLGLACLAWLAWLGLLGLAHLAWGVIWRQSGCNLEASQRQGGQEGASQDLNKTN